MKYKSQKTIVLEHLEQYGSITSLEAIQLYMILSLPARIYDLRKDGHIISREWLMSLRGNKYAHFILKDKVK